MSNLADKTLSHQPKSWVITNGKGSRKRRFSKERKLDTILYILNCHADVELTPKDVYAYIKGDPKLEEVNYNTVKLYLRELRDAKRVLRLRHGYKPNRVSEPTLGVGCDVWFGVHGVRFFVPAGRLSESIPSVVKGFLRFDFVVGKERGQVVVDVVVPKEHRWIHGIDVVCWCFVVDFVKDYLAKYCEVSLEDAWLVQLGFGFDTMGVLLDGVKSIRVFEAEEILVELYNKAWAGEGLRRSVHTLIPVKKSEIEGVLFGGLYAYKKNRLEKQLGENFSRLSRIVKENNAQSYRLAQAVIDRAQLEQDSFEAIDKSFQALDNRVEALTQGQLTLDQRTALIHNTLEKYYSSNLLILDGMAKHQKVLSEKFENPEKTIHNDNRVPQIRSCYNNDATFPAPKGSPTPAMPEFLPVMGVRRKTPKRREMLTLNDEKFILPVACRGCTKKPGEVEICRIHTYSFKLYGRKCPLEAERAHDDKEMP